MRGAIPFLCAVFAVRAALGALFQAPGAAGPVLVPEFGLDWTAFGVWLTMLLQARGRDVLRVKGLLDVGGAGPLLVNGVQHVVHPPAHLESWPDDDRRSRLVFIARGVEPGQVETSLRAFSRPRP